MQDAVTEAVRTMPIIVSQSTCEAYYSMASLCVMAGSYIGKIFNEMLGFYSDRPLTIPVGIDSKSAMDSALSPKDTARHDTLLAAIILFVTVLATDQQNYSTFKAPTIPPTV
jgi:hypothetical protein